MITGGAAVSQAEPAQTLTAGDSWRGMQRVVSPPSVWTAATHTGAWVYGDSITVGARIELAKHHHARTGKHLAVDANSGIPTKDAVDRLAARVKERGAPKVLVMATGANDAVRDPSVLRAQAARVRAIVGQRTHVVWANVYVNRPGNAAADKAGTAAANHALTRAYQDKSVDRFAPWYQAVVKAGSGVLTRDGVHPKAGAGVNAWVSLVSAAVC